MNATAIHQTLTGLPFDIVAQRSFSAQLGHHSQVPQFIHQAAKDWLNDKYSGGIFSHQAEALDHFLAHEDVALMTPTATGKTAIFQAASLHIIKSSPGTKVLALFPLVALTEDQSVSWGSMANFTGIRVGTIHGGIPTAQRYQILNSCDVILATPDVIHAWFMSNMAQTEVRQFREKIGMVILDEAHVYDGVFGANMAFFMARIRACGGVFRIICASATLGRPQEFLSTLTGTKPKMVGPQHGAKTSQKELLIVKPTTDDKQAIAEAIRSLAGSHSGQTLVFIDNRTETGWFAQFIGEENPSDWLPYRSGYEDRDRKQIQSALSNGTLRGVVATSALEAGIDIGSIELVVMVGQPAKMRSFWQRFGRLRNEVDGCAVVIDSDWSSERDVLDNWLERPVEPNHLYLDNPTLQMYSAMCINHESAAFGADYVDKAFDHLPCTIKNARHLAAHPEENFDERYQRILAQIGEDVPQRLFTLRSFERRYQVQVEDGYQVDIGHLTYSQVFQEGFPGAIYRYFNRVYRVRRVEHAGLRVVVRQIANTPKSTYPRRLLLAFSDFRKPDQVVASDQMMLADVPMNLRDTVDGFSEKLGQRTETFVYGTNHNGNPLMRTIYTTGVAIVGPELGERLLNSVTEAYCQLEGIHSSDIAVAPLGWRVETPRLPIPPGVNKGWAIADRVSGSLRLTSKLIIRWQEVLQLARDSVEDNDLQSELTRLLEQSSSLASHNVGHQVIEAKGNDLVQVFARGSLAVLTDGNGEREVTVMNYAEYGNLGWAYRLESGPGSTLWVKQQNVLPIPGISRMAWYSLAERDFVMSDDA